MGARWDGDKGGRAQWVAWLSGILADARRSQRRALAEESLLTAEDDTRRAGRVVLEAQGQLTASLAEVEIGGSVTAGIGSNAAIGLQSAAGGLFVTHAGTVATAAGIRFTPVP